MSTEREDHIDVFRPRDTQGGDQDKDANNPHLGSEHERGNFLKNAPSRLRKESDRRVRREDVSTQGEHQTSEPPCLGLSDHVSHSLPWI